MLASPFHCHLAVGGLRMRWGHMKRKKKKHKLSVAQLRKKALTGTLCDCPAGNYVGVARTLNNSPFFRGM